MEHIATTDNYRPARLAVGKEWMVVYWVRQADGRWKRIKEKLNHIKDPAARRTFGRNRVRDLNMKLSLGWNPLVTGETANSALPMEKAFEAFIRAKEREHLEVASLNSYRSGISILVQWLRRRNLAGASCSAFTELHAKAFLAESYVQRELSNRVYNNYVRFYNTVWNWLHEHGYTGPSVFKGIKKKRVDPEQKTHRPPTPAERKAIRDHLELRDPRFFAFCLLCYHCAIRPKEAFMLKPEHFQLEQRCIVIPGSISKNDRTQGVAIPAELLGVLRALQLHLQSPDHYVFSTRFAPGPKLKDSRYSGKAWMRLRAAIGLPKAVSMYQLKHAGAVEYNRAGLSEVDLMNHLRHHDLKQTTIYTRSNNLEGVRQVVDKDVRF
ncbi:MAG: site-specific integrase [Flavobacteriales bacterium]|nr:site-specific integrase [Flavobacteriales bacterium]